MTKENIKKILSKNFKDSIIEVVDINKDSSHFSLLIISNKFTHLNLINRHKLVYNLFKEQLTKEIHALQIKAYTQKEWKNI